MSNGEATAIFMDIERADKTNEEKGMAIFKVLTMATHNGITKRQMLKVIQWLFNQCFTVEVGGRE